MKHRPFHHIFSIATISLGLISQGLSQTPYPPPAWSSSAPVYPVAYTTSQKAAQVTAGTNMLAALQSAASNGSITNYTIPPGVYRITGVNNALLGAQNQRSNFTIHAAGVELVLIPSSSGTITSTIWCPSNCQNVTLEGAPGNPLVIDADPIPFSQGVITAYNSSAGLLTIQVGAGYPIPAPGSNQHYKVFDANGIWTQAAAYTTLYNIQVLSQANRTIQATVATNSKNSQGVPNLIVGNYVGMGEHFGGTLNPSNVTNLTFQDVVCCCSGGSSGSGGGAWKFVRFTSTRRPGTSRLMGGGHAGQYRVSGTGSSVLYDGCDVGYSVDDTLDFLAGRVFMVYKQTASNSFVAFHFQPSVGDVLRFCSYPSYAAISEATVTAVSVINNSAEESDAEAVEQQKLNFNSPGSGIYQVTLNQNVTLSQGNIVDDLSARCQTFTMQNCYFHDGDTRVMIQGVVNGTIQNNVFERINRTLYLTNDIWWWEGGEWDALTLQGNTFNQAPYNQNAYGIEFGPSNPVGGNTGTNFYGSATITENTFNGGNGTIIHINNAGGPLVISANEFINPVGTAIELDPVANAQIQGNLISGSAAQTAIHVNNSNNSAVNGNVINAVPASLNQAAMISVTGTQSGISIGANTATHTNGGQFEAEYLELSAYSGPTPRIFNDSPLSGGQGMIIDATAAGNSMTFLLPYIAAGTYNVKVGLKDFSTRGTFQLSAGRADNFAGTAQNIGPVVDEYVAGSTYPLVDLGTWSPASTTDKWFQFRVVGKNAASGGYGIAVDYILLTPQ